MHLTATMALYPNTHFLAMLLSGCYLLLFLDLITIFCISYISMNEVEKSIVEQSIALLNNSFSADDQVANKLVRDAIERLESLLGRKD
jgi:hypothetical protein